MRPENRIIGGGGEYFQLNKGVKAVYTDAEMGLESLSINEQSVEEDHQYTIGVDEYRYQNSAIHLGITHQELGTPKVIATSGKDILEEYFSNHQNLNSYIEGRLIYN